MKIKYVLIVLLSLTIACGGGNEYIRIELEPNKHLEDSKAGRFIKSLKLDYENGLYLTTNISKQLKKNARLIDEYIEHEGINVLKYEIAGMIILEKNTQTAEGFQKWFDILLDKEKIEWSGLIGEKSKELQENRKYECPIIISSKKDDCRLILCGFGNYCEYVSIIEAN